MGVLYDALVGLGPGQDEEVLDSYRRYESTLASVLTAEQMARYAEYIQRSGTLRVFDTLAPDELAALPADVSVIAANIMADEMANMENRRVAALLNQHGQHELAPDLEAADDSPAGEP